MKKCLVSLITKEMQIFKLDSVFCLLSRLFCFFVCLMIIPNVGENTIIRISQKLLSVKWHHLSGK